MKQRLKEFLDIEKAYIDTICEIRKSIFEEIINYINELLQKTEYEYIVNSQVSINEFYYFLKNETYSELRNFLKEKIREFTLSKEYYDEILTDKDYVKISKVKANKKNLKDILIKILKKYYSNNRNYKLYGIILSSKNIQFNLTHIFFSTNFEKFFDKVNDEFYLYLYEFDKSLLKSIGESEKKEIMLQLETTLIFFDMLNKSLEFKEKYKVNYKLMKDKMPSIEQILCNLCTDHNVYIYYKANAYLYIPVHLCQVKGIIFPYYGDLLLYNLYYAINSNYFFPSPNTKYIENQSADYICVGNNERKIGLCEYVLSIANYDSAYVNKLLSRESFYLSNVYSYLSLIILLEKLEKGGKNGACNHYQI